MGGFVHSREEEGSASSLIGRIRTLGGRIVELGLRGSGVLSVGISRVNLGPGRVSRLANRRVRSLGGNRRRSANRDHFCGLARVSRL